MIRMRAGDLRAFDDLYERYRVPVFTFLLRLTGHHHLAEDLFQETFLRVYRARVAYEPSGQFRAWLFTIARRLVVDHYRREKIEWEQEPEALAALAAPDTVEGRAEAREFLAGTERALRQLPPAQRELILLSRVAGMDTDEIARVNGSTPGAIRVAIHRALRRVRSLVEKGM
jgi:RNA polymerase sigma-70 factor (ECF subfamily)